MPQLTPGKYTIISVAEQRAIGLRHRPRLVKKPVFSLDPNHLNKIWNIKSVGTTNSTFKIGGYPIDKNIQGDRDTTTPAEWIIEEVSTGKYTIRNLDTPPKYWTLGTADPPEDPPEVKLSATAANSAHWSIVSELDVRGLAMIPGTHTVASRPHFAFGSNLSPTQMRERCESSHFVCVAVLRNWKWIITDDQIGGVVNGVANIVYTGQSSDVVYGSVYNLQVDDEAELDAHEGRKYSKVALSVQAGFDKGKTTGWQTVDAMTYVDTKRITSGPPRAEYIPRMQKAIKHALLKGVPWDYVENSMLPSFSPDFVTNITTFRTNLETLRNSIEA